MTVAVFFAVMMVQPVADDPLRNEALVFRVLPQSCRERRAAATNEIVVCASESEEQRRFRAPLPVPRPPGRADIAGGEQMAGLDTSSGTCRSLEPSPHCNVGINLLEVGQTIVKGIQNVIEDD